MKTGIIQNPGSPASSERAVIHESNGRGAHAGNGNARKEVPLPAWLKLPDVPSILLLMRTILIPASLSDRIGTRQSSAITTICRALLDYDADLRHLQGIEKGLERMEQRNLEMEEKLRQLDPHQAFNMSQDDERH